MSATRYGTGVAMVALAGMLWSLIGIAIRMLDASDTWQVLFWRSLGMIPVILAFVWWRSGKAIIARLAGIGWTGVIGACGLIGAFAGGINAIQVLPLANAVFLFSASPFLTAILGRVVLGERVRPWTWAAIALAGLGIWRMIGGTDLTAGAMAGNLSALGSALGFAVFTVALRSGKGGEMLPAVILGAVFSMVAAALVLVPQGQPLAPSLRDIVIILVMGALLLGLGMTLFTAGSRVVPAGEMALLAMVEVMLAPVWGWLVLKEVPSIVILQGGALILAAILLNAVTGFGQRRLAPA
jgi:drug/metabolite transporter, DME family